MSEQDEMDPVDAGSPAGDTRRSFITKATAGAAIAWAAPTILSKPAFAQGSHAVRLIGGGGNPGAFFTTDGAGSYAYSPDGGATWAVPTTPPGITATVMAGRGFVGQAQMVVADGAGGYWQSSDGGNNWVDVAGVGTPPPFAAALLAGGANSSGDFVAWDGGVTWSRSVDGGITWAAPATAPTIPPVTVRGLGGASGSFVVADGGGAYEYSQDGGNTWATVVTPPLFVASILAGGGNAAPSATADFVVTSAGGAWATSHDGGANFGAVGGPGLVATVLDGFGSSNGGHFVATDGTTYSRSTTGGDTWVAVVTPPPFETEIMAGGSNQGTSNFVVSNSHGRWAYSADGGATFTEVPGPGW